MAEAGEEAAARQEAASEGKVAAGPGGRSREGVRGQHGGRGGRAPQGPAGHGSAADRRVRGPRGPRGPAGPAWVTQRPREPCLRTETRSRSGP